MRSYTRHCSVECLARGRRVSFGPWPKIGMRHGVKIIQLTIWKNPFENILMNARNGDPQPYLARIDEAVDMLVWCMGFYRDEEEEVINAVIRGLLARYYDIECRTSLRPPRVCLAMESQSLGGDSTI